MNIPETTPSQWLATLQASGYQLGLAELLWYQRHTQLLDLRPTIAIQSKLAGSYLAKSKGRGMEFDEVRHYQPGDDVRAIDWRVTARTGKVHTKLFREEKERPVFILTDLSSSMRFGSTLLLKSIQAAHLASVISWHSKAHGDKLGGIVFSQQQHRLLKPASRTRGVLRYLQALVDVHQADTPAQGLSLAQALAEVRRLLRPGSLLYVLSDFNALDDEAMRHLQLIRQHNEVHCCQLVDPLEQQLPAKAQGSALVQANAEPLLVALGDRKLQQRYQQQQQQTMQKMQQQLQQLGCKWLSISSAEPLLTQLSRGYHGR
ncbi:MAG: DUF58 domain-containing protein [Alishewanella sp.]|nr:DUF58 domain-containing protein [Alishewanella sp.]MDP5185747.1 DUF58 domain-containing protein [Alishewanella sp.]